MLTRVFIACGVALYGEGLSGLLGRRAGIEVVGSGSDPAEVVARVDELRPDVVLLDTGLPDGMQTMRELALVRELPVIVLGCPDNVAEVIAYAEAGASGFLTPDASVAHLVATIRSIGDGGLQCSPRMAGALLKRVTALASVRSLGGPAASLTMRELQVVRLIDQGLSNKQIAMQLEIELSTVKHHVHHILEKLEVARRSEAVARLRQSGVLRR